LVKKERKIKMKQIELVALLQDLVIKLRDGGELSKGEYKQFNISFFIKIDDNNDVYMDGVSITKK